MIHYDILDSKRQAALPHLAPLKEDFYLAGGTGLALQLGHRDSIDFDFFSEMHFETVKLFRRIEELFAGMDTMRIQEEQGTLSLVVDKEIRMSFLYYPYELIAPPLDEPCLRIASIQDIAIMKLSAIVSRATFKDYVDMHYILKSVPLGELLELSRKKLPNLDGNLILKSLVYFEDVEPEPIKFQKGYEVEMKDIQAHITEEVKRVSRI